MAKTTICGDCVVITSTLKFEDIKLLERYNPDALALKDDEGFATFKVGTGRVGNVNEYGVTFTGEARDDSKKACLTIMLDAEEETSVEKLKEAIADQIGTGLINLKKVEEQAPAAIAEVERNKEAVIADITVA